MNLFPLILVGGGLAWLYKLHHAGDVMSINITQAAINGIQGITLKMWAEVVMDNFSETPLNLKQPLLKAYLGNTEIGNSPANDISVSIASRSRKTVRVDLEIPLANIPFAVADLMKGQKTGSIIRIDAYTEVDGIPYTSSQSYSL